LRRIPKAGDSIEEAGFVISVEKANERVPLQLKVKLARSFL